MKAFEGSRTSSRSAVYLSTGSTTEKEVKPNEKDQNRAGRPRFPGLPRHTEPLPRDPPVLPSGPWPLRPIRRGETSRRDGVSPHVRRHSYATNLRLRGMDLDALAELMGHESLETTRIYATLANEELRERYVACGLLGAASGAGEPPKAQPTPVVLPGNGAEVKRVLQRLGKKAYLE